MSTEYLIPVCPKHGMPDSATMHTIPANEKYFDLYPSRCMRISCMAQATQFIRIEVGL